MSTISEPVGTRTELTTTAANSLANGTYVSLGDINVSAVDPLDVIIEVAATPGTVSGNKQAVIFIKESLDNSNFSTGPESGTTATDEPNLYQLGVVPLGTNATLQRKAFSVAERLGWVPPYIRVIEKNDSGAALASSGNTCHYSTVLGNAT